MPDNVNYQYHRWIKTEDTWGATWGHRRYRTQCECGWRGQWWYSAQRSNLEQSRHSDLARRKQNTNVVDLMDALERSLASAKAARDASA